MKTPLVIMVGMSGLIGGLPVHAQSADIFSMGGDARIGYFRIDRSHRDGGASMDHDLRARIRLGAGLRLTHAVNARFRVAGRFSTAQERAELYLEPHAPSPGGLALGQATVDEAYLSFRPVSAWTLRLGRMQTKFTLADLMGKSLDRGDSPSTDITWTDGAHLTYTGDHGWASHLVVQHNGPGGPSNTLRAPLEVGRSSSRVTVFGAVENTQRLGAIAQRGLDITWIPGALPGDERKDYIALVGRGSLAWDLPRPGSSLSLGGEAGYAPAPESGWALQLATTLADLLPGHRIGLAYGRTDPEWLISPDFRPNDELVELRYQVVVTPGHSIEARARVRDEIRRPPDAVRDRRDTDIYVRYTLRF
jgi:hypothetical protein